MASYLIISAVAVACLFVLFLVLGSALNNIINQLAKVEYLLTATYEYGKERMEIQRMLSEQMSQISSSK